MNAATKPRVVVADDSALMRRIVCNLLSRGGIDVVGTAADGDEALALCERERPDAMTLDLAMPGMGGLDVLRALRARGAELPVVVVSAFSPSQGARAVDALAEGAFELVQKPTGGADVDGFERNLLGKIRLAARTGVGRAARRIGLRAGEGGAGGGREGERPARQGPGRMQRALLIATSTGGPRALSSLLPALPAPLGLGTLIVQHMPPGFTSSLAARLDRSSRLSAREAQGGEAVDPAVALVAPGGRHLRLGAGGVAQLSDADAIGGLRPRADLLIEDAARAWGERLTLVVLTGMGSDGLRGAREVKRHGGRVLVEDECTCTVYGMPRAIVNAGLADEIVPLHEMAGAIVAEVAC
ncbi:MAG TPA: chemotaxis-specific protein-glutamate methyltransferase CheB [Solirubrobacteraceae bacterium]|nr:chemotaxis-specific protein-glutamate methyltransferase CheB [Solirubrobacteraceae bacterium]